MGDGQTQSGGRLALIIGGGSGIGRGFAEAMASLHHTVIVTDVNEDSAKSVAGAIRDGGGIALPGHLEALIVGLGGCDDIVMPSPLDETAG